MFLKFSLNTIVSKNNIYCLSVVSENSYDYHVVICNKLVKTGNIIELVRDRGKIKVGCS